MDNKNVKVIIVIDGEKIEVTQPIIYSKSPKAKEEQKIKENAGT